MRGGQVALAFICLSVAAPAAAQPPIGMVRIGPEDFPEGVALGLHERVTRIRITLAPDGRVRECRVVGRRGEPRLDAEGCRILRERARLRPRYRRQDGTISLAWSPDEPGPPRNSRGAPIPIGFRARVAWNDYPPDAMRFNRQGDVLFEVNVSENGVPTACRVTQSSGTPALDRRTCELVMARGAFIAASDGGRRAASYQGRFLWRL